MKDGLWAIVFGHVQVNVTIALDTALAAITIVGPNDWLFGVAFEASPMCIHMQGPTCALHVN